MTTASLQGFLSLVMGHLLDFTPATGTTLRTRLGGGASARLYVEQAPDSVTYPYAVLSAKSVRETPGYDGFRLEGEIEVQVYHRPRGKEWDAQGIADVIEQACLRWADGQSGVSFFRHVRRMRVPLAAAPADRELVRIIVFIPVVCWPVMQSQYVTT
jgi:hypothetical protein